ncbi:MAG: MlaE family lipid ABC transporter permease subunit [Sphingomonadales bacterium]
MQISALEPHRLDINIDPCPKSGGRNVFFRGDLTIATSSEADSAMDTIDCGQQESICLNLTDVRRFDTAGAWLIYKTMRDLRFEGGKVSYTGATNEQETLIEQALINDAPCAVSPPVRNSLLAQVEDVGEATVVIAENLGSFLSFLGLVLMRLGQELVDLARWFLTAIPARLGLAKQRKPRMRITSLFHHMEMVGLRAVPIVGLICLLIGVVMVQQGAYQLRQFGAEVFVVNLIGIAGLRELGVLLTAIMVAGRSGSAFTAQIGSMKLNEELDAMRTIGLDPIDTLVIPRLLALFIMLPILTFFADIMVLFGGALLSWISLNISPSAFLSQLKEAVLVTDFLVGILKAPVFAIIIAVSGCFNGMSVGGDAESVGNNTTRAVVEAIFLVIVVDAMFAIFFTYIGW